MDSKVTNRHIFIDVSFEILKIRWKNESLERELYLTMIHTKLVTDRLFTPLPAHESLVSLKLMPLKSLWPISINWTFVYNSMAQDLPFAPNLERLESDGSSILLFNQQELSDWTRLDDGWSGGWSVWETTRLREGKGERRVQKKSTSVCFCFCSAEDFPSPPADDDDDGDGERRGESRERRGEESLQSPPSFNLFLDSLLLPSRQARIFFLIYSFSVLLVNKNTSSELIFTVIYLETFFFNFSTHVLATCLVI